MRTNSKCHSWSFIEYYLIVLRASIQLFIQVSMESAIQEITSGFTLIYYIIIDTLFLSVGLQDNLPVIAFP